MSRDNLIDATTRISANPARCARKRDKRNSNLAITTVMYGGSIAASHLGKM